MSESRLTHLYGMSRGTKNLPNDGLTTLLRPSISTGNTAGAESLP